MPIWTRRGETSRRRSAPTPFSRIRSPLRLYARDASMVEGSAGLVVFPTSTDHVVACVRTAAAHDLHRRSPRERHGPRRRLHADRQRPRRGHLEDGSGPRDPTCGSVGVGGAGRCSTSTWARLCEGRVHVHARPVLAAGVLDRRQRGDERRRAALPRVRRHVRPRTRRSTSCSPTGPWPEWAPRVRRPPGTTFAEWSSAPRGPWGSSTAACVRLTPEPPAIRTMLMGFATVEDCAATVSAIIAGGVVPAALEMMDQGIVRAVEAFAHAGLPDRRGRGAAGRGRRDRRGGRRGGPRSRGSRAGARRRLDPGGGVAEERALLWKGRKSAFGAIAQIAPHYHLHDCVVPRTKLVEVLTGVYAICRREGITVTNVFHAGDGNLHPLLSFDRSEPGVLERVLRSSRRSSGSASTPAARSAASTGSDWRSATSCRSCSRRTTSPRRRACGARSIRRAG